MKVAILSNSVGATPSNLYAGYDLEDCDAVVISDDHGLRKPEPETFRLVLGMLELAADQLVFVDDSPQHLPSAAELGFATVYVKDLRQTIADLEDLLGVSLAEQE
nr:HAD-IA family hydrolase [Streptomyces sp. AcE210]